MILFSILLTLTLIVAAIVLGVTLIAGGSLLVVFGDVIIFGLIIAGLIKFFRKKK